MAASEVSSKVSEERMDIMEEKVKKKRRILVRKNASGSNKSRNINCSLNSTLVKASLRSNNRALARALEVKKQDLYSAQQTILVLKENEQKLMLEVATLRGVAGLRNDQIEQEVNSRMEGRMKEVHLVLQKTFTSQVQFVEDLTTAMEICGRPKRQSSISRGTLPRADTSQNNLKTASKVVQKPLRVPRDQASSDEENPKSPESLSAMDTSTDAPDTSPPDQPSSFTVPEPPGKLPVSDQPSSLPELCVAIPDLSMIEEMSFLQDATFTTDNHQMKSVVVKESVPEIDESPETNAPVVPQKAPTLRRSSRVPAFMPCETTAADDNDAVPDEVNRHVRSRSRQRSGRGSLKATPLPDASGNDTGNMDLGVTVRPRSHSRKRSKERVVVPTEADSSIGDDDLDLDMLISDADLQQAESEFSCMASGGVTEQTQDEEPEPEHSTRSRPRRHRSTRGKDLWAEDASEQQTDHIKAKIHDQPSSKSNLNSTFDLPGLSRAAAEIVSPSKVPTVNDSPPDDDQCKPIKPASLPQFKVPSVPDKSTVAACFMGLRKPVPVAPPPLEQTLYFEDDMELTEILNVPASVVPVPDFIRLSKDSHEPQFLKDISSGDKSPLPVTVVTDESKPEEITSEEEQNKNKKSTEKVKNPSKMQTACEKDTKRKTEDTKKKSKLPLYSKSDDKKPKDNKKKSRSRKDVDKAETATTEEDDLHKVNNQASECIVPECDAASEPADPEREAQDEPVPSKRSKTKEVSHDEEDEEPEKSHVKRSRSKTRKLWNSENQQQIISTDDESSGSQSESDGEKIRKFSAFLTKPGKISFTTERKNGHETLLKELTEKSKSRSTLPVVKPRSKSRSKSRQSKKDAMPPPPPPPPPHLPTAASPQPDSVFEFGGKRQPVKEGSQFDVSLSDSVCGTKPSYSQFCGRDQPHPKGFNKNVPVLPDEIVMSDSPHGIMLVLGNGKRTKPRERSKSVSYARRLTRVKLSTPASDKSLEDRQDVLATPPRPPVEVLASTEPSCPQMLEDAGNTPVKRRSSSRVPAEEFCVPESPLVKGARDKPCRGSVLSVSDSPVVRRVSVSSVDSPVAVCHKRSRPLLSSTDNIELDILCSPNTKRKRSQSEDSDQSKSSKDCPSSPEDAHSPRTSKNKVMLPQKKNRTVSSPNRNHLLVSNSPLRRSPRCSPRVKTQTQNSRQEKVDKNSSKHKAASDKTKTAEEKQKDKTAKKKFRSKDKEEMEEPTSAVIVKLEPLSPGRDVQDHEDLASDQDICLTERYTSENMADCQEVACQEMLSQKRERTSEVEDPPRRRRVAVSYKEPSLGAKLRRGDSNTSTIYGRKDAPKVFKTKQDRKSSMDKRKRSALSTISNTLKQTNTEDQDPETPAPGPGPESL